MKKAKEDCENDKSGVTNAMFRQREKQPDNDDKNEKVDDKDARGKRSINLST